VTGIGDIFGGGSSYSNYQTEPTSGLNLLGKLEAWGIGTGTQVHGVALRVDALTGAQLKELIQKLPDGLTFGLELQKENG
jgi:hypothetical protein